MGTRTGPRAGPSRQQSCFTHSPRPLWPPPTHLHRGPWGAGGGSHPQGPLARGRCSDTHNAQSPSPWAASAAYSASAPPCYPPLDHVGRGPRHPGLILRRSVLPVQGPVTAREQGGCSRLTASLRPGLCLPLPASIRPRPSSDNQPGLPCREGEHANVQAPGTSLGCCLSRDCPRAVTCQVRVVPRPAPCLLTGHPVLAADGAAGSMPGPGRSESHSSRCSAQKAVLGQPGQSHPQPCQAPPDGPSQQGETPRHRAPGKGRQGARQGAAGAGSRPPRSLAVCPPILPAAPPAGRAWAFWPLTHSSLPLCPASPPAAAAGSEHQDCHRPGHLAP